MRGPTLTETWLVLARWPGVPGDIGVPGPGPGTGGDIGGSPGHPAHRTLPAHHHPPPHEQHDCLCCQQLTRHIFRSPLR